MPYNFQYVPTSGALSGTAFEEQTERAINELGGYVDTVSTDLTGKVDNAVSTANSASASATEALGTANIAITKAESATIAAIQAHTTAIEAKNAAESATTTANTAIGRATGAVSAAEAARAIAESAQGTAEHAATVATEAASTADTAFSIATTALGLGTGLFTTVDAPVDLNDMDGAQRLYLTSTADNLPIATPAYVEVVRNDSGTSVTQRTWSNAEPQTRVRLAKVTQIPIAGSDSILFRATPSEEGAVTVEGELTVTSDGATELTTAFLPGSFTPSVASPLTLSGTIAFTVGDIAEGVVSINDIEAIRLYQGAPMIDQSTFSTTSGRIAVRTVTYHAPVLSLELTYTYTNIDESVDWGLWEASGSGSGVDGYALLDLKWSTTGLVDPGFLDLSQDNGLLLRSAYPEAWAKVQQAVDAGLPSVIADSAFTAQVTAQGMCGCFSKGDGSNTFRVPLLRKAYIRAADPVSGLTPGMWQTDTMRPITGSTSSYWNYSYGLNGAGGSGAFYTGAATSERIQGFSGAGNYFAFDSGRLGQHYSGSETRPVTVVYTPLMKMYGAVTDAGTANITQLLQQTNAKLDTSVYEGDARTRVAAAVTFLGNGTILKSKNVTSITRYGPGSYGVFSPQIHPDSVIVSSALTHALYGQASPTEGLVKVSTIALPSGTFADAQVSVLIVNL